MMTRLEKLCSVVMGRRLESIRQSKNLTATEVAALMAMRPDAYRQRELGRRPITLSFLCLALHALSVPIERVWFRFPERLEDPDQSTLEMALEGLLETSRRVTLDQVIEIACEAFRVPVHAVTSGDGSRKANQVRAASALIVESIPHLKLVDLAYMVRRSPRRLIDVRVEAQRKGKLFWKKVAAIREEVESL